jgi:hypothetical protein
LREIDLHPVAEDILPPTSIESKPQNKFDPLPDKENPTHEPYPRSWMFVARHASDLAVKILNESGSGKTVDEILENDRMMSKFYDYLNTGKIPQKAIKKMIDNNPEEPDNDISYEALAPERNLAPAVLNSTDEEVDFQEFIKTTTEGGFFTVQAVAGEGLGDQIREEVHRLARNIAQKITESTPPDTRFAAIAYDSSAKQTRMVEKAANDAELSDFVKTFSPGKFGRYPDVSDLARESLTNPDFSIRSADLLNDDEFVKLFEKNRHNGIYNALPQSIHIRDIEPLLHQLKYDTYTDSKSKAVRLLAFVSNIQAYRNYDVSIIADKFKNGRDFLKSILEEDRRKIGSINVRFDMIGMSAADPADLETRAWLDAYMDMSRGNQFGTRPMLSDYLVSGRSFPVRDVNTAKEIGETEYEKFGTSMHTGQEISYQVYERLRRHQASIQGIEIKIPMIARFDALKNDYGPRRLSKKFFRDNYEEDAARSVLGWTEHFLSTYWKSKDVLEDDKLHKFLDSVGGLSTVSGEKRREFLKQAAYDIRDFLDPFLNGENKMLIVGAHFPLFAVYADERNHKRTAMRIGRQYEAFPDKAGEKWRVQLIPHAENDVWVAEIAPERLFRMVRQAGRHILKSISMHKIIESQKYSQGEQSFSDADINQDPGESGQIGPIREYGKKAVGKPEGEQDNGKEAIRHRIVSVGYFDATKP